MHLFETGPRNLLCVISHAFPISTTGRWFASLQMLLRLEDEILQDGVTCPAARQRPESILRQGALCEGVRRRESFALLVRRQGQSVWRPGSRPQLPSIRTFPPDQIIHQIPNNLILRRHVLPEIQNLLHDQMVIPAQTLQIGRHVGLQFRQTVHLALEVRSVFAELGRQVGGVMAVGVGEGGGRGCKG